MKDSSQVGNDDEFNARNLDFIKKMNKDQDFCTLSKSWFEKAFSYEYLYHFRWMGRPIIQFPHDIIALQEIIWNTKPDVIIETGIARGGSLIFYASMLAMLGSGKVIGIDTDIREHNKIEIENHPMNNRIHMIEGSSIDPLIVKKVSSLIEKNNRVMVVLDSNHTEEHVLKELEFYSKLVSKNNYLVVFDTVLEYLPDSAHKNRPWGKGNNPYTATQKFLLTTKQFIIDKEITEKLIVTSSPNGYLKRID